MGGQVLELQSEKDQRMGREQMQSLIQILISQGRNNDLIKIASDSEYCQQLLEEFVLLDDTDV